MKQLITMLLLAITTIGFAQDKYDFKNRTKTVANEAEWLAKKKIYPDAVEAYAGERLKAITSAVDFSDEEKVKLTELFKKQYTVFKSSYDTYASTETAQSKINLIKTLLENEDELRKMLNEKQLIYYMAYHQFDYFNSEYVAFRKYNMPDFIYYTLKKELL